MQSIDEEREAKHLKTKKKGEGGALKELHFVERKKKQRKHSYS